MRNSAIEGDFDAVLWTIADDREWVFGAIALSGCKLINCRLDRVGLAVRDSEVDAVREGFGLG